MHMIEFNNLRDGGDSDVDSDVEKLNADLSIREQSSFSDHA